MRILVTGAAGFVGSHLVERLLALGHEVLGLDCLTPYYARALKLLNLQAIQAAGATHLELDLADDDLAPAVEGVDYVFHLAAQPGISAATPFETYARNNIMATHRLLEALRGQSRLRGLINIATSSIYGANATGPETSEPRPTSAYGVTKLAAEQLILARQRDEGLPACSVRLFSVYGPRERPEKLYPKLIRAILEGHEFPLFAGSEEHLRSFTYVGDIVDGLVAILDHMPACNGEIINLGSDTAITTSEGIRIVEELIGQQARLVVQPKRPGDQLRTHANIAKARRLLAYEPKTSAREGLAHEVDWYRSQIDGRVDF
jgi:nucleoside-diphosphate-sugar epimerase